MTPKDQEGFAAFFADTEPRLRRALVATYGSERGREAAAEALGWAWEHWAEVQAMTYPVGYLYRVGQSRTREPKRRVLFHVDAWSDPEVEPALAGALEALSEHQRVAVVLVHGFAWTMRDVGELLGVSVSTVQNHLNRALVKLRIALEVNDNA